MQLIGHSLVPYEPLFYCKNTKQLQAERENFFKFNQEMIKTAQNLGAVFSVICESVSECIIANAAGAKLLIILKREFAPHAAKLAESYLFDAKIACMITNESELNELADYGVDVAIFSDTNPISQ